MLLVPLFVLSITSFSSAYILMYRVSSLRYALVRFENYVEKENTREACLTLGELYRSYDPEYLIYC